MQLSCLPPHLLFLKVPRPGRPRGFWAPCSPKPRARSPPRLHIHSKNLEQEMTLSKRRESKTMTNNDHSASSAPSTATIPTSLIRQCITLHHPNHKISNDALEMASEFIRLVVIEARRRASIEVRIQNRCGCGLTVSLHFLNPPNPTFI